MNLKNSEGIERRKCVCTCFLNSHLTCLAIFISIVLILAQSPVFWKCDSEDLFDYAVDRRKLGF